jgi:hypothetical protein
LPIENSKEKSSTKNNYINKTLLLETLTSKSSSKTKANSLPPDGFHADAHCPARPIFVSLLITLSNENKIIKVYRNPYFSNLFLPKGHANSFANCITDCTSNAS